MVKADKIHSTEFEDEVNILISLRHPNIVQFMGVCVTEDMKFIVTEFMSGKSLESILYFKKNQEEYRMHQALSYRKKLDILMDVLKGLIYMHSRQPPLLHRDLKPSNILVCYY
jgi:serine/threonine protein kinase